VIYLITFACYGAHLHGDDAGSVDRNHNVPGSPMIRPHPGRSTAAGHAMKQAVYVLDQSHRDAVLASLIERSSERGWTLLAAHVRTNHIHVVVQSDATPERVMNDLKSYASRVLNRMAFDAPDRKRWARHGSTRWLRDREDVSTAIEYVIRKQGTPMAVFVATEEFL
jgi:REP element-mobilizing transposase RayT